MCNCEILFTLYFHFHSCTAPIQYLSYIQRVVLYTITTQQKLHSVSLNVNPDFNINT
jgi:uncharacterized membrane protein